MEEKYDEKWNLEKITWTLKQMEKKLDNQDSKIEVAKGFNLNIFRVIFSALAIVIAVAVVIFSTFGVTSWRDIKSIGQLAEQVERMKTEIESINKAIQKASLKETIPLYFSRADKLNISDSPSYDPYFYAFMKRESYAAIHFSGEFRNLDIGDTAHFRFFATDKEDTVYSDEYKIYTSEYTLIEANTDISSLKNGQCEYAYGVKTKGEKGVDLRNIYILIYSKLFIDDND